MSFVRADKPPLQNVDSGACDMHPNKNDPTILIPAVCHPTIHDDDDDDDDDGLIRVLLPLPDIFRSNLEATNRPT